MTHTDRAFINAFGVHNPPTTPARAPGKAPLSAHLARRRAASPPMGEPAPAAAKTKAAPSVAPIADAPFQPGVIVDSLPWPEVACRLAEQARSALLDVVSVATGRGNAADSPAIAVCGVRPGVGATSVVLATARLISGLGGRVALVDCSNGSGAARGLGVRRRVAPEATLIASHAATLDELLVSTADGSVSVLALASGRPSPVAWERLAATHDLIVVDAGSADALADWSAPDDRPPATLLVDHTDGPEATRRIAVGRAAAAALPVCGLIEVAAPPLEDMAPPTVGR